MTENRTVLLYFAGAAAIMIALATAPRLLETNLPSQPIVATTATIIEIKGKKLKSRSLDAYARIAFRSPKGLIGFAARDLYEVNCRVGDIVKVHQQGVDIFLDDDACTRHRTNPQHS